MSSVDDRIVNMQFNNKQFETGVATSTKSLTDLEKTLANTAKSKGLDSFGGNVEQVTGKFSAMRIAGITAVATIANKAVNAGIQLVKSLTIDPLKQGFAEYQTNLNSIQTILANTGKPLGVVQDALNQLNHYSDQTIYNFSQMAKNIGRFTAAGVKIGPSVSAIKGMANSAALSGASVEDLNRAMYQTSQALGTGLIRLMDWKSLENANLGGKNMRDSLIATAHSLGDEGKAVDSAIKKHGSFRDSLTEGWLTTEVFSKTMKVMGGQVNKTTQKTEAYSVAQLKAMGYDEARAKELHRLSAAAIDSATVIKTFPQMLDVVRESIGSVVAQTFTGILGNFTQSKNLWTTFGNAITDVVGNIGTALNGPNGMITKWAEAGGRFEAIRGFTILFKGMYHIVKQLKFAFQEVFPGNGAGTLFAMTDGFWKLMRVLRPGKETLLSLRSIFAGVFAVLHIGFTVVKAIGGAFIAFFGEVFKGSGDAGGGVLSFAAGIGDMLVKVDKFLTSGGKMIDLFKELGHTAGVFVGGIIQTATNIIAGLISGIDIGASGLKNKIFSIGESIIQWFKDVMGIHSPSTRMVEHGYNIVAGIAEGILDGIGVIFKVMGIIGGAIADGFQQLFGNMDALDWVALMNALFTGGLLLSLSNFFGTFNGIRQSIVKGLNNTFKEMTNTLSVMQSSLKAGIILKIGIAVGILTASLIALTLLDPKDIGTGLGALASMVTILVGAMAAMSKIGGEFNASFGKGKGAMSGGGIQLLVMGNAMIAMASAMLILAAAVTVLGRQDPQKVATGIGFMGTMMAIMVGSLLAISKIGTVVEGAAGAILIMATAMNVMTVAVMALGMMDPDKLEQGLTAIAVGLTIFVAAMYAFGKSAVGSEAAAGAIFIMAGAMVVLATAVGLLGNMDVKTLKKGLGAIAIGIGIMVAALLILSANTAGVLIVAQAMAIMSLALIGLATAVGMFGNMDPDTLSQGFVAISIGLLLLIAAAAAAIAVAPGLLVLNATFYALGISLALAGAGMFLFATGFALLAAAGIAGVAVMAVAFQTFMMLLPQFAIQIAAAFVSFIETIAAAAPRIHEAMSTIFAEMVGVVIDNIPVIAKLIQALIDAAIGILKASIPQWIEMGMTVITKFVQSAAKHVPEIADAAGDLIVSFIKELDSHLQEIISAGTDLIVNFIEGVADAATEIVGAAGQAILEFLNALDAAIVYYGPQIRDAGLRIIGHLLDGMTFGLASKGGDVIKKGIGLAGDIAGGITGHFKISSPSKLAIYWGQMICEGLGLGITRSTRVAVGAAITMANAVIAEGNKAVATVQKTARKRQIAADRAQAKADATRQAARRIKKTDPKLAKKLMAEADRQQKQADSAQALADRADQTVEDTRTFEEADFVGKAEIKDARATALADRAEAMLARANAEAARARKLMETNAKAGRAMLAQARKDAQTAKKLAEQSLAAHTQANNFYKQEVEERLKAFKEAEAAKKEQEEFDAATAAGKADILKKRAEANEAKAAAAKAESLALIESAKAIADTDAAKALRLLDLAEEAAKTAEEAAAQAKQEREQAQSVLNQGSSTPGAGGPITPSRSILEDAASVVDRYSASLAMAEELAAAQQGTVQFNQNNYSPEALSASEIYRQSKNLLSTAEVKMGVSSTP